MEFNNLDELFDESDEPKINITLADDSDSVVLNYTQNMTEISESSDYLLETNTNNDENTESEEIQNNEMLQIPPSLDIIKTEEIDYEEDVQNHKTHADNDIENNNESNTFNKPLVDPLLFSTAKADNAFPLDKTSQYLKDLQINQSSSCHYEPITNNFDNIAGKCREAMQPVRVLSFNMDVPIINLSKGNKTVLFFTSGHLGVIYDVFKNNQFILRGHVNSIKSISASKDRRWLASGDSGPDSVIFIWDANTGKSVRTIMNPHPNGILALKLTPDARYLATLSADPDSQVMAVWNWTTGDDIPLCYANIQSDLGLQTKIVFKTEDYYHILSNSEKRVIFYHWAKQGCIQSFSPTLNNSTLRQTIGKFTMSIYLPNTTTALTATSKGSVVVWVNSISPSKSVIYEPEAECYYSKLMPYIQESCYKMAKKIVPLHTAPITYMDVTSCTSVKTVIVTGDANGQIRFSDPNFKLLYWYNDFRNGGIASVSFAENGLFNAASLFGKYGLQQFQSLSYSTDASLTKEKFVIEDFMVSTTHALLFSMQVKGKVVKLIEREHYSTVNAASGHPKLNLVAFGGYSGLIKVFNYKCLLPVRSRQFEEGVKIHCLSYDPMGELLGVGFTSGRVLILDAITLEDVNEKSLDFARDTVTHIGFSDNSFYCAYIDSSFCTTLLRRGNTESKEHAWEYVGRHRAHCRTVVDLTFKVSQMNGRQRLFTLSEDRTITEYDLENLVDGLLIKKRTKIEQMAIPRCFASLPADLYKEDFICMATSWSKFRIFNTVSMMCRKTIQTPCEGAKFVKIITLPERPVGVSPPSSPKNILKSTSKRCLVYVTDERLGLILLPLDGDPYKTSNVIAHPSSPRGNAVLSGLAVSHDGRFAFTTGGPDNTIHMWKLDPGVVSAQLDLYGDDMEPFYKMLTPEMLNDMKDYFYLAMLRKQGFNSIETRKTSLTIPITEIPFVMRAIGYYPTDEEIEIMINEAKYLEFHDTGYPMHEMNLDTFIKMYINHRETSGMQIGDVEEAFHMIKLAKPPCQPNCRYHDLCIDDSKGTNLHRDHLLTLVQTIGEPVRHDELVENLAVLLGLAPESGKMEDTNAMEGLAVSDEIERCLPPCFTAETFVDCILGMIPCKTLPPEKDHGKQISVVPCRMDFLCQTE